MGSMKIWWEDIDGTLDAYQQLCHSNPMIESVNYADSVCPTTA
jgi:hypothetical protein